MPAWSRNFAARRTGEDAQRLVAYTYFGLRYGLAALAFVFPVALWGIGAAFHLYDRMPGSISGYYHTDLRNYVVATLVLIGALLFLYKGFNRWENVLLNIAGATTVLIAFFPTGRGVGSTDAPDTFVAPQVHGTLAVITFVAMGVVAIFFGPSTLDLLPEPRTRRRFLVVYRVLGALMIVLPLLAVALSYATSGSIFLVESAALWVFVGYWIARTVELRLDQAESLALAGTLAAPEDGHPPPAAGPARAAAES